MSLTYLIIQFCSPFSLRFYNDFLRFQILSRCLIVLSEEKCIINHYIKFFKFFCVHTVNRTSDCFERRIFMGYGRSGIVDFVLPRRKNVIYNIFIQVSSYILNYKSFLFSFSNRLNNIV